MNHFAHKILYAILPLKEYLKTVSSLFFLVKRTGYGRTSPSLEYVYHLDKLITKGGVAIDIGANMGYYTHTLSKIVKEEGRVHAIEPVPVIYNILQRNTKQCKNVQLYNVALGEEDRTIAMANNTVSVNGYFGTGRNYVLEDKSQVDVTFSAQMRKGTDLFSAIKKIDFIKCDIEGYEVVVMNQIKPIIELHRPVVLIESGGENRQKIIDLFTSLDYLGYTLYKGQEIPLTHENTKDIIFRPNKV